MSYQDAAATQLLATACCCCSKPLVDAKSVELGIGPICREKHGFNIDVDEASRQSANKLVHRIAVAVSTKKVNHVTLRQTEALRLLGFNKLAGVIELNSAKIIIREVDGKYRVRVPFSPDFNARTRTPGRYGVKEKNKYWWVFPNTTHARRTLWAALNECYAGSLGMGPKGAFVVTGQTKAKAA